MKTLEIKKLIGDKVDPSLYILLLNGESVFESHDKKQTIKAKNLTNDIVRHSDKDVTNEDIENILELTIKY